jgi:hypothetical protein
MNRGLDHKGDKNPTAVGADVDRLARAIFAALEQHSHHAFMRFRDGRRVTIDGKFDLVAVARQVLTAL